MRGGAQPPTEPPSGREKEGRGMDKPNEERLLNMVDFATRVCMGAGQVDKADHAAMRPVTPYDSLAWTTALAIVRERMEAAKRNAEDMSAFPVDNDSRAYSEGRYHALRDCLDEMEERGKP